MDPAVLRDDMVDGLEHSLGRPLPEEIGLAMRTVPRREFVEDAPYDNRPSTVDGAVTLAPGTVARLLTALDPREGDDALVVGAGAGYTAAVLAEILGGRHVHALDIARPQVYRARSNLDAADYGGVLVDCREGSTGLPEYAPYDRILVEAAAVEPPSDLLDQLADGGRLVIPKGNTDQTLVAVTRDDDAPDGYRRVDERGPVRFAPLLVDGEQPGVTRNRTRREDREHAQRGASPGWEHEWLDWDERLSGRKRSDGAPNWGDYGDRR
ncbi:MULTISPECIES: protein-L-isoaspartate O-methyltransferase family protein [Halolamina]|uniref:protein-L-isoaspartate(D-aspartate) O-methyltransferase n=1 Tax=Halolamina pelagica TaxID=699431 RepID=A0A1I5RTV5_9EURY|nr:MULTISPECIES: protein-L-isoaspartate O-methyltransferase [Halolamina]NHX35342.1 protein-L-isoaspartate O-methyltransferase [Halolamina sp. R1-12]SFP61958.1 protein-L-isoaspartate(D-aspartate) O-methyltransferase [Halolamina pelagica]